jgi:transposase
LPATIRTATNEPLRQSTLILIDVSLSSRSSRYNSAHALLVCDGAGWHQPGERLIVPDNITLLRLPPYAPELNRIANVWDYLRGNKLSSLVCDTYEAMRNASKEAWNFIANDPARIVSIGTRDWACVKL